MLLNSRSRWAVATPNCKGFAGFQPWILTSDALEASAAPAEPAAPPAPAPSAASSSAAAPNAAVHAATALHRLGRGASRAPPGEAARLLRGSRGGAEALARLLEAAAERLPEMGIRELSNALHGVANLSAAGAFSPGGGPGAPDGGCGALLERLLGAWEREAGRKVHGANAQEVANLAWACARLGLQPGAPLRRGLLARAGALAGELSPQGMAGVLLGAARLGWVIPEGVLAQLEEAGPSDPRCEGVEQRHPQTTFQHTRCTVHASSSARAAAGTGCALTTPRSVRIREG